MSCWILSQLYRKFLHDCCPLDEFKSELHRKGKLPFIWTSHHQDSFEQLRHALTGSPVLQAMEYSLPHRIITDASSVGIGAVLEQKHESGWHPVVYLSRKLNPAEKKYSATKLECLAIHYAVNKLHQYIYSLPFELITDHSALQWLFDLKTKNSRLLRWALNLEAYREYAKIVHRPGKLNINADILSRQSKFEETINEDTCFSKILAISPPTTIDSPNPSCWKEDLTHPLQCSHLGGERTLELVQRYFYMGYSRLPDKDRPTPRREEEYFGFQCRYPIPT